MRVGLILVPHAHVVQINQDVLSLCEQTGQINLRFTSIFAIDLDHAHLTRKLVKVDFSPVLSTRCVASVTSLRQIPSLRPTVVNMKRSFQLSRYFSGPGDSSA